MSWKMIADCDLRNGQVVRVREEGWEPYFAKYWSPALLAKEEWEDAEHGWYQFFPERDEDGDVLVHPTMWFDPRD